MPQAVQSNSTLPSRKSRNSGLWFSRQRLRRPVGERLAEQLARLLDAEEVLLVGRFLVGVGGRDHHLVDLEVVVEEVEHLAHRLRGVVGEEGRVGRDPEAARLRRPDRRDGLVEDAAAFDRGVVALAQPVQVDRPREVRARREVVELLLEQDRVGAQIDEPLALDQFGARSRGSRGGPAARRRRSRPSARRTPRPPRSPARRGIRRRRMCSGCWILPQPAHARLHWNSGSSSTISGNLSRPRRRCRIRYSPCACSV